MGSESLSGAASQQEHSYIAFTGQRTFKQLGNTLRGVKCEPNEALHARFGKYRNLVLAERDLQEVSDLVMKSAISIFDRFNDVRNNRSLAHDNDILAHAEARYVFDVITALLRFVRSIEAGKFENAPKRVPV